MLNCGSKTSMPCKTLYNPGIVKAIGLSYCPTVSLMKKKKETKKAMIIRGNKMQRLISYKQGTSMYLPAISWKVLVIMKSVWFIAIRSAVNWHEKWYFSSNLLK